MHIGIVGAGHAGVEAARVAREAGAEVSVFSAESVPPYFRPRLPALAFGQVELEAMLIHPAAWYDERGIHLRLGEPVKTIDPAGPRVITDREEHAFDALILAGGAEPIMPPFAAACPTAILPLWDADHAARVRARVWAGGHAIVVGGGILGIEAALRARDAGMTVTVLEKMDRLMPAQFGARASRVLLNRLHQKGVQIHLGRTVVTAQSAAGGRGPDAGYRMPDVGYRTPEADRVFLTLDDGQMLSGYFVLLSIGARPACRLAETAGLQVERGIRVDATLKTSAAAVYAAGDAIQFEGITRCSVREATAQGKIAGANAVAARLGTPLQTYTPATLPLTFKNKDFEIYAVGDPSGQEVDLGAGSDNVFRSLVVRDGITVGVQMIGTREGFDTHAARLGRRAEAG